jgi:bifunctional DNase/RNase
MRTSVRVVACLLLSACLAGSAVARDRAEVAPPRPTGPQEAEVIGVMIDQRSQQPAIVLQGKRDRRQFAMAIDVAQVTAIAVPLSGITPPRPLTHDLFLTLFGRLKVTVTKVAITDLRDDVYYATVHLEANGAEMTLDSRPSDAIALAIRAKAPVFVEDRVFDKGAPTVQPQRRPSI